MPATRPYQSGVPIYIGSRSAAGADWFANPTKNTFALARARSGRPRMCAARYGKQDV